MTNVLCLRDDEIRDLAGIEAYVEAVRDGFRQYSRGAECGVEEKLSVEDSDGVFMYYGALFPEDDVIGVYVYSGGFASEDTWFLTVLADAETGEPIALLDSPGMNPYKTGATGGLGVDVLARQDASHIDVFGSGLQARTQLLTTTTVRDIEHVCVYSPTKENRETFASEMETELDLPVIPVGEPGLAVKDRDIIVTATRATTPVFDGDLLEPGVHVTAMGQSNLDTFELDAATVARSTYVLDIKERMHETAGAFCNAVKKGVVDQDHVHADIGEILVGDKPGRRAEDEITVFDMGGTGIETIAASHMIYERAIETDAGRTIPLTPESEAFRMTNS